MSQIETRLANVAQSLNLKVEKGRELEQFYKLQADEKANEKRIIVRKFEPKRSVYIVPLADPHIGHYNCDVKKLMSFCQFIDSVDNCYTVLLGDQAETATRSSVGMGVFDEEFHIDDQMKALYSMLKPLADKGKILGVVPGNHEMRVAQLVGINPVQVLADSLNIDYLGFMGFLDLRVGDQDYNIMVHHGIGSGVSTGSKVNSVEKLGRIAVCDLYLTGHTHIRHVTEDYIYEVHNGALVARKRYYVTCGSFLGYWNGYAEMKALTPAVPGGVCIELMADTKDIRVIL